MHKFRNGCCAYIMGDVVIRQKNGLVKSLRGSKVKILYGKNHFCLCDIGREKPIYIPTKNLKAA